jgi:hypothetical protein
VATNSIWLVYGFGEGPWHGRQIWPTLKSAGYIPALKANDADIIIAHSAGCFYLPDSQKPQQLVLIDPPYWPDKSVALSFLQKTYLDLQASITQHRIRYWLRKTLWNLYYILQDIPKVISIIRQSRLNNLKRLLRHNYVTIVRHQYDAFCTPEIDRHFDRDQNVRFISVTGQHDDCWHDPDVLIPVIQMR